MLTVSPWLSLACLPVLLCQKSIERRSQPVQMENCPSESTRDDLSEDLRCRTPVSGSLLSDSAGDPVSDALISDIISEIISALAYTAIRKFYCSADVLSLMSSSDRFSLPVTVSPWLMISHRRKRSALRLSDLLCQILHCLGWSVNVTKSYPLGDIGTPVPHPRYPSEYRKNKKGIYIYISFFIGRNRKIGK